MARPKVAFAFLALLSVASAERSLFAHKASGGTHLHALAVTGSNYYTSNGNGTWAIRTNSAYQAQSNCYASATQSQGKLTAYFVKGGSSITDVYFPSRLLGLAVGAGCSGYPTYTDMYGGTFAASTAVSYIPKILSTYDMGVSWQYVSGFGTKTKSFAQTQQLLNNLKFTSVAPATTAASPAPDLTSVFCATRALCYAAGGYFGTEAAIATALTTAGATAATSATYPIGSIAALVATGTGQQPAILPRVMPVAGAVLTSTNGGTTWNYVTVPVQIAASSTTQAVPIPGLMDIASDASGRHVYAVGAPFFKGDYTIPSQVGSTVVNSEPYSAGPGVAVGTTINTVAVGTIIYSGSYGASNSWLLQTAPIIPLHWYGLNAVTVLRGTTALTVGGSPFGLAQNAYNNSLVKAPTAGTFSIPEAAPLLPSGCALLTMNGGFSWMIQTLPSWSYYSPVFVRPYLTSTASTYDTVDQTNAMLPGLNDVACYNRADSLSNVLYNCIAVGDWGYAIRTTIAASSINSGVAPIMPTWRYINITQVAQNTGYLDLYGISWDNGNVGYIFGQEVIVSTHDGGITWMSETPGAIVSNSAEVADITAMAMVPTTY